MTHLLAMPAEIAFPMLFGGIIFIVSALYARFAFRALTREIAHKKNALEKSLELERKTSLALFTSEMARKRQEFADEIRRERQEIDRLHAKAASRHDLALKKEAKIDELKDQLDASLAQQKIRDAEITEQRSRIEITRKELLNKLEQIAGMSQDEAHASANRLIAKIEEDARQTAKERASSIVVGAMQRFTAEQVNQMTVGVVQLPNEEMKGRIIGKEGRNIKALEMATGMEFIIGDAPEVITISGFNPIRREIARRALEKLIIDGRINPTRIEETVEQVEQEIEEIIEEYGQETIMRFKLHGVKSEVVSTLGKLHFRTSFSQNVLQHSIEVGVFARMIAEELGCERPEIALRGGLLHDIGKALSAEQEGPHALIGADLARRCGEDPLVVNAIAAHHEEVPFQSIYSPIVMIADTISACRPGARRETLTTYIKRLEKLEEIAHNFHGVKRAYAVQAGREVRVIVEEAVLTDEGATHLARDLARKIEEDMAFPGQIKVNVIREKRTIEYAR